MKIFLFTQFKWFLAKFLLALMIFSVMVCFFTVNVGIIKILSGSSVDSWQAVFLVCLSFVQINCCYALHAWTHRNINIWFIFTLLFFFLHIPYVIYVKQVFLRRVPLAFASPYQENFRMQYTIIWRIWQVVSKHSDEVNNNKGLGKAT